MTKEIVNKNKFKGAYVEDPKNVGKETLNKLFENLNADMDGIVLENPLSDFVQTNKINAKREDVVSVGTKPDDLDELRKNNFKLVEDSLKQSLANLLNTIDNSDKVNIDNLDKELTGRLKQTIIKTLINKNIINENEVIPEDKLDSIIAHLKNIGKLYKEYDIIKLIDIEQDVIKEFLNN